MMISSLLSIVLFGEGLLTGITLTLMLGPVTMVILRYGIQVNRVAGVWAATGTWSSDFVFIFVTFWMTASVSLFIKEESSRLWIYLIGGSGLIIIGALMALSRKKSVAVNKEITIANYARAFLSGFLVNSLSPFTLFFWIGVALFLHLQKDPPMWYYLGLMITLSIGDFLKAWLAPQLTRWIRERYIYWVQVIAGALIVITGIYVLILGIIG